MAKKYKTNLKLTSKTTHPIKCRINVKSFDRDVEALSYKQLLRTSSAVSATSDQEKAASKLFYHSLTPPEMRVAKAIQRETNPVLRSRKIRVLQRNLRRKNEAEIVGVNIDAILQDAKNDPDL